MKLFAVSAMLILVLAGGCARTTVTRVDSDSTIDLSGHWNDADSRMVAEAMIGDCLSKGWIAGHADGKPVVIVGSIRNKTAEHIETTIFVKDIERALLGSGMVQIVASAEEREGLRDERIDQRVNAEPATIKEMGRELGADYMLIGVISSQLDERAGKKIFYFQTDLELVDIESNLKVWMGSKKIKKLRSQKRFRG